MSHTKEQGLRRLRRRIVVGEWAFHGLAGIMGVVCGGRLRLFRCKFLASGSIACQIRLELAGTSPGLLCHADRLLLCEGISPSTGA